MYALKTVIVPAVECNKCGRKLFTDDEFRFFTSDDEIDSFAKSKGWRSYGKRRDYVSHICPQCLAKSEETE